MGNSPANGGGRGGGGAAKEDRLPDDVLLKEQISMRLCTSGYQNIVQCRENNNKKKTDQQFRNIFFPISFGKK